MSGVSLPVNRPSGRSLVIGSQACRALPVEVLLHLGYHCNEADDPFAAMAELCRRPMAFRSVVLCLNSIYREELSVVAAIKRRFPHVEVWLAQTDGRAAALAEASRLGADGLLSDEGLHRFAVPEEQELVDAAPPPGTAVRPLTVTPAEEGDGALNEEAPLEVAAGEPVLTAEELRALLQEPVRAQQQQQQRGLR